MNLALYTTIHPGTRPYLQDWYASVQAQSDQEFDLWIGIDEVHIEEACDLMGIESSEAHWVVADGDDTPAMVRQRAWEAMLPHIEAVVMTDSDDMLRSHRIEQGRKDISNADVASCSLELIGQQGETLNEVMPPATYQSADVLPYRNVFGLSNTTYRASVLRDCLPLPDNTILADWYLATQAWLQGYTLHCNPTVGMAYRQHNDNTLALLPPFTRRDIRKTTEVVQHHFELAAENLPSNAVDSRKRKVVEARNRVDAFAEQVVRNEARLANYVEQLNDQPILPLWWACVDHPDIQSL